ncbi:MAG: hypothetical protein V4724_10595 [Pseudomonadota bacterium]
MKTPLRTACILMLSLSLSAGGTFAETRPSKNTGSSSSFKGGFSSQKSSTARNTGSSGARAAPQRDGNSSFGSFGSARSAPDAAGAPARNSSALSRDMTKKNAEENALRTLENRRAAAERQNAPPPLPPLDPVVPRQAPQYGGGYNNNNNNNNGGYGYGNNNNGRSGSGALATAGAAAAGAAIGAAMTGHANAAGQRNQGNMPVNNGPLPGEITMAPGSATSTTPTADAGVVNTAPAVNPVPATQSASSGLGFWGWVLLAGFLYVGWKGYRYLTRPRAGRPGSNYSLGD